MRHLVVAVLGAAFALLFVRVLDSPPPKPSLHERLVQVCAPDRLVNWSASDPLGYIPEGMVVATCDGADGPYQKAVLR